MGLPIFVHRTIPIPPYAFDFERGFVHPPPGGVANVERAAPYGFDFQGVIAISIHVSTTTCMPSPPSPLWGVPVVSGGEGLGG
jgi:hypothetical protein